MTSAIFDGRNDGVQIGIHHGPFTAEFHRGRFNHVSTSLDLK
jgi:hypothetical protein